MQKFESTEKTVLAGLADLISSQSLIAIENWKSICYQIPTIKEVYDVNEHLFFPPYSWSKQDPFTAIYEILEKTYDMGHAYFYKLLNIIIEGNKLDLRWLLTEHEGDDKNYSDVQAFLEYGSGELNYNFKKLNSYLIIFDLEIKVIQDDSDRNKLMLTYLDNHAEEVQDKSYTQISYIESALVNNPKVLHDFQNMIKQLMGGEYGLAIHCGRETLAGFFNNLAIKEDTTNEDLRWGKGVSLISDDPIKLTDWNEFLGDFKNNQKFPRLRFIYAFYKLSSTIGTHSSTEIAKVKDELPQKATREDAIMCKQVVTSILYWALNNQNKS